MQIKLYEGSGEIEFVYNNLSGSQSKAASIGLTASSTQYVGLDAVSSSPTASTSTTVITSAGKPASGQIYRFAPPTNVGSGLSFGSFTSATTTSLAFNWTHTTPGNTLGYLIESSSNSGSTYSTLGTVFTTSYTATGLSPSTAYLFRITPITEGFVGASSAIVSSSKSTNACSPFSGTVQIGSTGSFSSITKGLDSLKNVGFTGNLVFELQSSYTSAGETFPITIPDFRTFTCSGSNPRLTIRPASGASNLVISGNNSTALFIFDNAYGFTFDGRPGGSGSGRQISFSNINTTGTVFTIINDALKNTIRNCNIRSANTNAASGAILFGTTTKLLGNDSNIISNNLITRSSFTANLASAITSSPTANLLLQNDNNTIDNNEIHSWLNNGVNITASIGNGEKWNITNNSFYDSATSKGTVSSSWTAINFIPGTNSNSVANNISGNYIGGTAANCGGSALINSSTTATMGGIRITCAPGTPTLVQNNTIQNISFTDINNSATFMGINPAGGSVIIGGASGKGNTIGHNSTSNSILTVGPNPIIGISASTANDIVISYNTIANITQNQTTNTLATGAVRGIVNTAGATVTISNNIIKTLSTNTVNAGTAASACLVGIVISSTSTNQYILDNIIGGSSSEAIKSTTTTGSTSIVGIQNSGGITLIKRNKISSLISSSINGGSTVSSVIIGINNSATTGGIIDNNQIVNISATASATTAIVGIYVASVTDVTNNLVSGMTTASTSTAVTSGACIQGIFYNISSPATILNNTLEKFSATANIASQIMGINSMASLTYIKNNKLRNFYSNSLTTGTGLSSSIVGIGTSFNAVNRTISGNTIYNFYNYSSTGAVNIVGIYFTSGSTFGNYSIVNNNFIHSFRMETTGLGIITGIMNGLGISTVQNNMIRLGLDSTGTPIGGPYTVKGIVHSVTTSSNYYNNSIYLGGSLSGTTNSACIEFTGTITSTETINLRNNIFYNNINNSSTGRNACIRILSNARIFSNYNILFAPGSGGAVGIINATAYTSLTGAGGWNATALIDGQSSSLDPKFIAQSGNSNTVDLHLSSSNPAEGEGDPTVTTVMDDYDGQIRSGLTPNDIGADAGNFSLSSEKNPPLITYTPLLNTISTGNRILSASIFDNIGLPLPTSANAPRVYYKKGSGTYFSSPGTLASGTRQNGIWNFTINATTLGGLAVNDVISYYIIAQDSAANIISNPMYAVSSNVNTITTDPVTPNTYTVTAGLPTTIQVGSGQTYTSLTAATTGLFNAINTSGLQGNTIVEITSDLTETGAVALNQWMETGGSNFTLTIRPSAAALRVVSGTGAAGGMIRLNGADRVKITGIPSGGSTADTFLAIKSTSSSNASALTFLSDAVNNTIENCVLEASPTITPNTPVILISNTAIETGNDNNTIIRCHIRGYAGAVTAFGIYSSGNAPSGILPVILHDNITIRECQFYNFTTNGISVTGTGNGNNWRILNNHFYWKNAANAATAQTAINFIPGITSNNDTISGNFIGGSTINAGGAVWNNSAMSAFNGILSSAGTEAGVHIQNNTIKNLLFSGTGTLATLFTGINISGGVANVGGTTGNIIGDPNTSNSIQTNGDAGLVGINSTTAFKLVVNNNSVSNLTATGGTVYTSTSVRGITITSGTLALDVNNNTVKNLNAKSQGTGSSTGAAVVGIGVGSSGNVQNILNNTIRNLKNLDNVGSHCMVGLYTTNGANIVKGNVISGLVSSTTNINSNNTTTGIIGLLLSGNLGNSEYSNNTISDIQYTSSTPAGVQIIGLFALSGSTIKISDNSISSLNSVSNSSGSMASAAIIGLSYSGAGTLMTITNNKIHSLNHNNASTSSAVSVIGIYYTGATTTTPSTVSRNWIHSLKVSGTGSSLLYGIFNGSGYTTFENNMIRLGIDSTGNAFTGPYNVYGIYQNYGNVTTMYYHNSIYLGGSPASGSAATAAIGISTVYSTLTTRVIIKNNILNNAISNSGSSGINNAIQLNTAALIYSDNNILYSNGTGGKIATLTGTSVGYTNLSGAGSWQLASGQDLKSGSSDPKFVNPTGKALVADLHLTSSNPAEGGGSTDLTTTIDYDGNLRSTNTPSDIGAHSGNFTISSDVYAPVININPLYSNSSTSGTRTLANVSITDNAGIHMSGSNMPRIYYSKNGTSWSSSAATSLSGTSKNAVAAFSIDYSALGGVSMGDTIRYYVIAQDNSGNLRSNALYAIASDVNTVSTHPTLPLTYNIVPALAGGTKLRVGTGKTYTTLTGAGGLFEYLNSVALSGDVTAVISSNLVESGLIALNQMGDNGSGNYTLTIRPDSLSTSERLISGNYYSGLIRFNGADRVKITGVPDFNGTSSERKLRFRNSSNTGHTFLFLNEAVDNRLNNLNIEGTNLSATAGFAGVIYFGTSTKAKGNSRDTVSNCLIAHDPTYTFPLGVPNVGIHSFGSIDKENTANVIMGNEITNFSTYGVWISNVGNGNFWKITGNSFYRSLPYPTFAAHYCVFFDAQIFSGGHTISNNFMGGSAKNCGGSPWVNSANVSLRGISCTSASMEIPTNISNNVVQNILMTNVGTGSQFIGIAIITIGNFNITNNLIGHPTDINSITLAGSAGHIGILTQSNSSICNIRGNAIQGINMKTPGVNSTFLGISLFFGSATAVNNTIGSATVANSIQYAGASLFAAIQSIIATGNGASVLIDSNTVANITSTGPESNIQIRGIYHSGTAIATITNNKVFNFSVNSSNTSIAAVGAVTGIANVGSSLGGLISNNTVFNLKAVNTGAVATCAIGIGLTSANNVIIANNRIYDIGNASTNTNIGAPATSVGINIASPQNVVTLQNNQISLGTGQSNGNMFVGIWHAASGNFAVNSYFNSVYIGGTASTGVHASFGYLRGNNYSSSSYTSIVNAKNNIFMNDRKGGTGKHYAIGNQNVITTAQNGWQNNASNYNFLSNSSSYPVGLWNISDYNFSDWKTNSNCDLNSIYMPTGTSNGQMNPDNLFTNATVGNLNLLGANTEAAALYGKAIPISGISKDFRGISRNATAPTIGSSEAIGNDLGITAITSPVNNTCGKPATSVTVTLKNFGLLSQSNIPIKLNVSGAASLNVSEVFTGTIAPNTTASYTFTNTFNSTLGGNFLIKSSTGLSNDDITSNDTSAISVTLNSLPKPAFTYIDTCAGNSVKFTSTSTVNSGTITSNSWRFGDGTSANGNSASHQYSSAGISYSVKIISTSSLGCTDSSSKSISILSNLAGGSITGKQSICFNSTPTLLSSTSAASGSKAPYTYQWQSSTDSINFTNISGANGLDYQPGALTINMYYRRSVNTTSGCGPSFSNTLKVTVNSILTSGVIGSSQTICFGGTGSAIGFTTSPTGAFGTYTYQWQQSPDSATWSNILGQTGSTFTPTNLTNVTFYRTFVFSGSCSSVSTNGVKIKLYSPITGGSIAAGQTICAGTTPAAFTQVSAPSGGPGSYTFQWQSSTDSINWNNISGANSAGYASPAVSGVTYFQRLAQSTGCPSGTSNALKIKTNAKPTVNFTAASHCYNDPMPLTNTSTISPGSLTYLWKFGDGTTSTSSVPNKTYSSSGTYNVTLVATSNIGCKDSSVKSVVVATSPTPAFTFTLKCLGDSVIFKDETVYACGASSGLTFLWNFGDGTTSNVQNARKHYNSAGTYNVKFRLSLPGGYKDSITKVVVFNIRSTPSFTATNNCFPGTTSFTHSSTNYASLAWSFGDGSSSTTTASSFTKTYSSAGTYSAKLVSTSSFGCKDSVVKSVSVFSKPSASFSVGNNCVGLSTTFNNASSGATTYSWNFGDGSSSANVNPSYTYSNPGTYSVKLKVTSSNGCVDSVSNNVTIHPNPTAGFTTANVCNGFQSSFTNTSTGAASYNWNFGNGNTSTLTNPTYTYPTAGTYSVTLTATTSNGCSKSTTQSYTVNSAPTAAFTASNVCVGSSVTFNNTSTGASSSNWNFGDATTSTTTSPTKTYASSGTYSVKLAISNSFGCKDSITKSITIFAKPVVGFTSADKCLGTSISFTNQTTGANAYVWDFGNGKSSASTSPDYTYPAAGTYSVKLIAFTANGCKDSLSKSVNVFANPALGFSASPNPICRGGIMNFTNTSTNAVSYNWTFGNGNTSTLTSPSNIYNTAANYNVKLLARSSNGCRDSIFRTVTVWPRPIASFSVNDGCATDNLNFASNSVSATGYAWTFGDGNTSTVANPSKGYTTAGTYNVKLIVTSINGCLDTTTSNVTVFPRASVSFTNPTNFCVGTTATFTNTSTLSSGTMTFQWKFGDGNTSSSTNPTNTYALGGNYTVTLSANTDKGCVNTATSSVIVFSKPTANFNVSGVCQGTAATFNNTSVGGTSYSWDFGDAGTSTLSSPTHTYTTAGTYTVKLTTTNANNCSDVFTKQVTIYPTPVVNFTATDRCIGQATVFTNTSTNANDVYWQFGDGNTSNSANPVYTYGAAGAYNVTLNVESANGCTGSLTKTVNVFAAPKAAFSTNLRGQCINGNSFVYTDNSTIASGTYSRAWTLGDGTTSTASAPTKTYATAAAYNVKLVVSSTNGCKDSASDAVVVYPKPTANFSINNASQCLKGNSFIYTDASTISDGAINRSWALGDGTTSGGSSVTKTYAAIGSYTVVLNVSSDFGCSDNISKTVTVNASPVASFSTNNDKQCLNGNVFNFTNTTTGAATFSSGWKLGDGSTSNTANASRTYSTAGIYRVSLNVSTPSGCKDSAYYTVKVLANPAAITISGLINAPLGSKQTYSVPFNAGSSYNWTATNGVVLSNGSNVVQVKWNTSGATGSLSVTETGDNGCSGAPAGYNVTLYDATSVSSLHRNDFSAKLYPNPAQNSFTIDVSSGDMINLNIYDQLGKRVIADRQFNSSITLADHHLAAGVYTVKLTDNTGKVTILRFEVQN